MKPKFKVGDTTVIEERYTKHKDFYIIEGIFNDKYLYINIKTRYSASCSFDMFEDAGYGCLEARLISEEEKLELL